jgi:hypothetical protein
MTNATTMRQIWCENMCLVDSKFHYSIRKNTSSLFQGIRIVKLKSLIDDLGFSDPTIDPRDILCFVEKCVDERFMYNRSLPAQAYENPAVKFNYRQAIVDFGVPGAGCLYSPKESEVVASKIANYLRINQIPVYVSEAHEGCGAVQNKMLRRNQSTTDPLFVNAVARQDAQSAADKVAFYANELDYPLEIHTKFATMDDCFRIKGSDNQVEFARIHNGSGIVFLPNFFEKKEYSKVFLPDKFCLSNGLCMFNMIDTGPDMDSEEDDSINPNCTAEYIVFCIQLMLGAHGLGEDFFRDNTPLTIIGACDVNDSADTLRAYTIIKQVKELITKNSSLQNLETLFDFIILEF